MSTNIFRELDADDDDGALARLHQRLERDDYVRWHNVLADQGWGAPNWPVEHGGTGWNALQRLIFEVECFKAGAPRLLPFGLSMIGPVLMKYGSAQQQASRPLQDEATRAWNFHTALYYKAGGTPWRLPLARPNCRPVLWGRGSFTRSTAPVSARVWPKCSTSAATAWT